MNFNLTLILAKINLQYKFRSNPMNDVDLKRLSMQFFV